MAGWLGASPNSGDLRRREETASDVVLLAGQTLTLTASPPAQHLAVGRLYLLNGEWAKARSVIEHGLAVASTSSLVHLPGLIPHSAWALAELREVGVALERLEAGERILEHSTLGGITGLHGLYYQVLGRAALQLGRPDEARRLGDRAIEWSPRQLGVRAHTLHLLGDIATHLDQFDAESGEAHYRQALALAEPRGMRPSSLTATSASPSSTGARTSASRPASTSRPRRRCTARWTCASGWSRRRRSRGRSHEAERVCFNPHAGGVRALGQTPRHKRQRGAVPSQGVPVCNRKTGEVMEDKPIPGYRFLVRNPDRLGRQADDHRHSLFGVVHPGLPG